MLLATGEAAKVDNQAHIEELSSMVQQAMTESSSETSKHLDEINKQKEIALSQQLHESVQGLLKMNQKTSG